MLKHAFSKRDHNELKSKKFCTFNKNENKKYNRGILTFKFFLLRYLFESRSCTSKALSDNNFNTQIKCMLHLDLSMKQLLNESILHKIYSSNSNIYTNEGTKTLKGYSMQ